MTATNHPTQRPSRRLVLLGGGLSLAVLYAVGAVVVEPQIEDDLTSRVPAALSVAGYSVTASFSGQDGTLRCAAPLADPTAARRLALDVYGVRAISLDPSCGVDGATPAATTTAPTTVPATAVPSTVPATTTTIPDASTTTTTTVAAAAQISAELVDGTLVLSGTVGSDLTKLAILERARTTVAAENIVDQLTVDLAAPEVSSSDLTRFLNLVAAMPSSLSAGQVGWTGSAVTATGAFVDELGRVSFQSAADQVGAIVVLAPRPSATAEQAAALETELNTLVAAQPILFEKGSTVISPVSQATVQRVAGIAKRYAGVRIEVQGHTDSEGDPARNLTLSEQRAGSVLDALVALGVPAADLSSAGFGMTQLILDANGDENPVASRRVVFGVALV